MMKEVGRKPKILLLTQYFYPDITAASFRMYELYKYLLNEGFEIEVVTTNVHRSNAKLVIEDSHDIHRVMVHFASQKNKLRYIYYYLEFVIKSLVIILKNRLFGCELIFVSSPPIFVAIEALFLSLLFRKKLLLDVRDLWPDSVVDVGKIKVNSVIYNILKRVERILYRKASRVFCVSQPMKEYILAYTSNVTVVYNGISNYDFLKFKDKPTLTNGGSPFNVFYAGNVGMAQTLDFVFDAADELQKENNVSFIFHIIGEGVKLKDYQEIVEKNKLENVIFHKSLLREELLDYLYQNADILLLPLKRGFSFEKTIPSKLFDYLLLKEPIVYHVYGECREILLKLHIGEEFELNGEGFLNALQEIASNYGWYQKNAQENNFQLLQGFLRETQFQKVLEAINGLY